MGKYIKKVILLMIASFSLLSFQLLTGGFDYITAEAEVYEVTIQKIEFKNSNNEWVTYYNDASGIKIDLAGSNSTIGKGNILPAGTYSEVKLTLSPTFTIKGYTNSTSLSYEEGKSYAYTLTGVTSNIATQGDDADDCSAQVCSIGESDITGSATVSFTISENNAVAPNIAVDFDLSDAIMFYNVEGGNIGVKPYTPAVNITVDGAKSDFNFGLT